jgi:hypothetical protein
MIGGDSFAMDHGVGEEKRFGHLLSEHLGRSVEVDVLATSGYAPVIYRNVARKALSLASYRAVAVFVDQTDPADDLISNEDMVADSQSAAPFFSRNSSGLSAPCGSEAEAWSSWGSMGEASGCGFLSPPETVLDPRCLLRLRSEGHQKRVLAPSIYTLF